MGIYTRTGDNGTTDTLSGRTGKDSPIIWVYGSVDELAASLGMVLAFLEDERCADIKEQIKDIIKDLYSLCSEVEAGAGCVNRFKDNSAVLRLEALIDRYAGEVGEGGGFVIPCGHKAGASLHVARTISRRAERYMVSLGREREVNKNCMSYINRLSDYLFTAARVVNKRYGIEEQPL